MKRQGDREAALTGCEVCLEAVEETHKCRLAFVGAVAVAGHQPAQPVDARRAGGADEARPAAAVWGSSQVFQSVTSKFSYQ